MKIIEKSFASSTGLLPQEILPVRKLQINEGNRDKFEIEIKSFIVLYYLYRGLGRLQLPQIKGT